MRVTAEQFQWRQENRITGTYEIRAPRTFRTLKARQKAEETRRCENCGRETDFLLAWLLLGDAMRDI